MCRGLSNQSQVLPLHEQNLIEKLGGPNQYEFLILSFCENILEDSALAGIYKDYDIDSLADLQKNLLNSSFIQQHGKGFDENARNRIILQNYALFESGLNAHHFDLLQKHFTNALHDCWIQGEVFDLCEQRFNELRSIFEDEGKEIEDLLHMQRRVVEMCILSASGRS